MEAYITLLSTPGYLPGVLALARSLQATGTRHPLVVALSPDVDPGVEAALRRHGLPTLRLPRTPRPEGVDAGMAPHWLNTFDKLQLFGLVQYRKLVYLDSDMMVLDCIDELFARPHMSAVPAGRLVHPDWVRLNSGLMVIEPAAGLPQAILATLPQALQAAHAEGHSNLGDQDLINAYYADWPRSRLQLDESYNLLQPLVDRYLASGRYTLPRDAGMTGAQARAIKVLHFIGAAKPWSLRGWWRHVLGCCRGEVPRAQRDTFAMYRRLLRAAA
jgi:hypothetical protein